MWCKDEIQKASTKAGNAVSGGLGMRRMLVEPTAEGCGCEGRILASTDRYISRSKSRACHACAVITSRISVLSPSIVLDKIAFYSYIGQFSS